MAALKRLRHLDARELRFRLAGELRKTGGRVRAAVSPPRWSRRALGPALRDERRGTPVDAARQALVQGDWRRAHDALASHFAQRTPGFPLNPRTLPGLAASINSRFPHAREAAVTRADRMRQGRYDILGYKDVTFGSPPDWQADPVHGRRPPMAFWSQVPYLDPVYGDHKVIWEINRHQHWLGLARAYHLSGNRHYYDTAVAQLENWMATNPPLQGVNWASALELGFRSLSWLWSLHHFAAAATNDNQDGPPWIVDLLLGIDRQLTHVEQNLSTYFSPNTHLTGEALALYVAGRALPELAASERRAALGRDVLLQEIDRQINADGGHAELSPHYHRYSTDFYLLATLVARQSEDPAAARFEDAARRQSTFLRAMTDDEGRMPLIGDDDGGQLFPVCGRESWDCRDTLSSAAWILNDPALAVGDTPEETFWFCGAEAVVRAHTSSPGSVPLAASGYYVSRTADRDHLVFDAGHHGYLNGGHAHADALSVVLTTAGRPFLVDPGTATYTMDAAARDRFRSTAMHNTVVLDRRSQSEPGGAFHWTSRANATCPIWQSGDGFDYAEGIHDGYLPKAHARGVLAVHGLGWIVIDHILNPAGTETTADIFWHVHPDWHCTAAGDGSLTFLHRDGTRRALASTAELKVLTPEEAGGLDAWSPVYGRLERGLCVRARVPGATVVATIITSTGLDTAPSLVPAAVADLPPKGWQAAAFRLSSGTVAAAILTAVEEDLNRFGSGAPGLPWGSDFARTDARLAFLRLSGDAGANAIVINGTSVEAPHTGAARA